MSATIRRFADKGVPNLEIGNQHVFGAFWLWLCRFASLARNQSAGFGSAALIFLFFLGTSPFAWTQDQTPTAPVNLLANGGFENWVANDRLQNPGEAKRWTVKMDPADLFPEFWIPGCEKNRDEGETTGVVALDDKVEHGGRRSLRIESKSEGDITLVRYSPGYYKGGPSILTALPNHRYLVRWWVKGEKIDPGIRGTGVVMMGGYGGKRDGKGYGVNFHIPDPPLTGTFDWTQRKFQFVTDSDAVEIKINFQLRQAKGTVWFDDIELIDKGAVPVIQSF